MRPHGEGCPPHRKELPPQRRERGRNSSSQRTAPLKNIGHVSQPTPLHDSTPLEFLSDSFSLRGGGTRCKSSPKTKRYAYETYKRTSRVYTPVDELIMNETNTSALPSPS
ncbi:unnamed protein product, partial [Ectocarpus sp. 12 AP-2014]